MGAQCADGLPELADRVAQFTMSLVSSILLCSWRTENSVGSGGSMVCLGPRLTKPCDSPHNVIYNTVREDFERARPSRNSGKFARKLAGGCGR